MAATFVAPRRPPSPWDDAPLPSRLLFGYAWPLLSRGYRAALSMGDLWAVDRGLDADGCAAALAAASSRVARRSPLWLLAACLRAFGGRYAADGLWRPAWLGFVVAQVMCLRALVAHSAGRGGLGTPEAVGVAVAMGLASVAQSICINNLFTNAARTGLRARAAIMSTIYTKALAMPLSTLHETTGGMVQNLASNDTRRVVDMFTFGHFLWTAALDVGVVVGLLYNDVGASAFVGAGILLLVIPLQVVVARRVGRYQSAAVACTDARTRTMAEILKGILVRACARAGVCVRLCARAGVCMRVRVVARARAPVSL